MGCAVPESRPRRSPAGLLGRDDDIRAVARALETARLVTLTGAPGIGKSRLALAVGDQHPEPAVLVELASLADPSLIPAALASALSVQEGPGQSLIEMVAAALKRRRLLLVLDNCEHLRDACARTIAQLLDGCPCLRVLTTSREPLDIDAERVWSVAPLAVSPPQDDPRPESMLAYSAVALFVDRAAQIQPGFTLQRSLAGDVADICRRLDGIPLALELAAARVATMTPREIARRLGTHLGLLNSQDLGSLPRHQTLAAALDWSYALLTVSEQAVMRCLSVFPGTFELEAAAAICAGEASTAGKTAELLDRLVAKSLLVRDADRRHVGRYRMLQTVRAYAAEQLERSGFVAGLRTLHASFYTALAEQAAAEFTGPRQLDWFGRIAAERANLRAALEWSLARGDGDQALRLTGGLVLFWRVRGPYSEGRELLQAALAAAENGAPDLRARSLWGAGFLALMAGQLTDAVPLLEESLAYYRELGDRQGCARALLVLADARAYSDEHEGWDLLMESVRLARAADDHWCLAHALGFAGFLPFLRDELDEARVMFAECLAVARKAGDMQGLRFGLIGLGRCAVEQGDYREAELLLSEAVEVTGALGEAYDRAEALTSLGVVALARGEHARARELVQEAIALIPEMAPPGSGLASLVLRARLAHIEGDRAQARALLDELSSWNRHPAVVTELGRLAVADGDSAKARDLFEEALAAARAEARQRDMSAALHELALLARAEGDPKRAAALHDEALGLQYGAGDLPGTSVTLEAAAGLLAGAGSHADAALLLGAAGVLRRRGGYTRPAWASTRFSTDLALVRRSLSAGDFERAFATGEAIELHQAVSHALGALRRARVTTGWPSLTAREREVAELVAEGLSNTEIAERLTIARETVKTHVSTIFAKLGVNGRSTLARSIPARSP